MRAMMGAVLRERGHVIVEAKGAREAVEKHREQRADLIITDLVMREMDGTELLRRVRTFAPETPIIAVSGAKHGKMYLNMAKLLGAERILAKPFAPEELLRAVEELLGGSAPSTVEA